MIYLPINKFDKNKNKGKIIKSMKRYKYLVHHTIRIIPKKNEEKYD